MKTNTATFVKSVMVTDPDTRQQVEIDIYKHDQTGQMLGIDAKFLNETFDLDETPTVTDPFNNEALIELNHTPLVFE